MWCKCGVELSLGECEFEPADDACLSHASDAVVFCGAHGAAPFSDGQLRLVGASGAPALPHDAGRLEMYLVQAQAWAPVCRNGSTSGSAAVACKSMGFAGSAGFSSCGTSRLCGAVAPHVSDLACAGSESSVNVPWPLQTMCSALLKNLWFCLAAVLATRLASLCR